MKALAFDLVVSVVIIGALVAMPLLALARAIRAARAMRRDRRVLEELIRSIGSRP